MNQCSWTDYMSMATLFLSLVLISVIITTPVAIFKLSLMAVPIVIVLFFNLFGTN